MANQTADREPNRQEGRQLALPASNLRFYRGSLVAFNGTNNYLVKAADTAAFKLAGVVAQSTDLTASVAGVDTVEVYREGIFTFATSGAAPKLGDKVYMVDDQTVAIASVTTADIPVGIVVDVPTSSDTGTGFARVQIDVAVKGAL